MLLTSSAVQTRFLASDLPQTSHQEAAEAQRLLRTSEYRFDDVLASLVASVDRIREVITGHLGAGGV